MLDSARGSYQRFFRPERPVRTIFLDLSAGFLGGRKAGGGGRRTAEAGKQKARSRGSGFLLDSDGAGDRSRTYDLRITNALLYQLSYTGNKEVKL